jgi:hypothetical protein
VKNKLFIYIPTFGREEALRQQLSVLCPQVLLYKNNVRLLIRDNNSEGDYFFKLGEEYYEKDVIEFERNFGNIDGNANIALGFISAKKDEFIWLLSDNDIINDNSIRYLLEHINLSYDLILFNYSVTAPERKLVKWNDGLLSLMEGRMGLISNALYNTNYIRNSLYDAFYYHNSSFPHLAVGFSALKKNVSANLLILPRDQLHSQSYPSSYGSSKHPYPPYSIGQVGMPQLLPLFSDQLAKSFALGWVSDNSKYLYLHKNMYPGVFYGTTKLLIKYGGVRMYFYLLRGAIYAFLNPLTLILVKQAKQKLPTKTINVLKKIRTLL